MRHCRFLELISRVSSASLLRLSGVVPQCLSEAQGGVRHSEAREAQADGSSMTCTLPDVSLNGAEAWGVLHGAGRVQMAQPDVLPDVGCMGVLHGRAA